jgi:hypothetical protein
MVSVPTEEEGSSIVNTEELKQMSVPKETMLGAANSAVSGGIASLAVSAGVSALKKSNEQELGKLIMQNIKGTHFLPIVVATAAFTALGAMVRFFRASKYNEQSDRQNLLLKQQAKSHAERLENTDATQERTR